MGRKLKTRNYFKEIVKGIWKRWQEGAISCEYAPVCSRFGSDECFFCKHNEAFYFDDDK